MKKGIKNIEFVFLLIISSILLTLLISLIALYISVSKHSGIEGEGAGFVGAILILSIIFCSIITIWQYRLWISFSKYADRKYFQLILVFIFGIFPFLNFLIDAYLTHYLHIKHPITEYINKAYFDILLFPFTRGE